MKNILKLTGILLIGLFLISCGGKQENGKSGSSEGKQKVKVGTEGVYAPFTFTDGSGKLTGYDVEVVEEIGKRANLDIEFVPTPWDSMFLGLESKKFDFIANEIAKNPEREKKYTFSDDYLVSAAQIIVKKGRTDIKTLEDLKGKRVMTGVGSNYNKTLTDFDKNKEINYAYFDGNVSIALEEIAQGKVDATLNDRLTVGYFTKQRGNLVEIVGEPVTKTPVYFTFRKDSEELKNKINKALAEMKADGTLAKISEKWFGGDYTK